jgi:hypothetical protein
LGKTKDLTKTPTPTLSALDKIRGKNTVKASELEVLDWDAMIQGLEAEGQVLDASQVGEGFHLLQGKDDKKKLVGQPLAIIDWSINPGRFGGFATLKVRTQFPIMFDGQAYKYFIINDGGTGIARQIQDLQQTGFAGVIVCKRGLRVSEDYEVMQVVDGKKEPVMDPATNKPVLGTTFYLDTSL